VRERDVRGRDESLDQDLSALVDGELDAAPESELRRRVEQEPELAARLAEFEGVDEALRALPARTLPDELAQRLHARLEAARRDTARGGAAAHRRRRTALRAGAALAAAAAIALAWIATRPSERAAPWKGASEEDLEIALDLDVLDDLDVLERLDLLERLEQMEEPGRT